MIRTAEDLSDRLARDLSWRRKELVDLRGLILSPSPNPSRQRMLSRCAIALLYAHFEGFIRVVGQSFFEFVAMQRLRNDELREEHLALIVRKQIASIGSSRKASAFAGITKFFASEMGSESKLPYKTAVDTESNLSSRVLREITWCLGIDYAPYEGKQNLIDKRLLGRRNYVAHGDYLTLEASDYDSLHQEVLGMMELFRNQVENQAVLGTYRRA